MMIETAPPKSPLLITAIQLGLLLFAIYYLFIGGQTAQGIYDHRWRLITLWLTSLIGGSWLLWRFFSRSKIPRTPLDWPLLFLLVAWILASLFSVNPVYSREMLVFFITYLLFFYIAADLGRWPWLTELAFNAIIGAAGLVWTLALLQLSWWYRDAEATPALLQTIEPALQLPRLSVLGNPNTMASFLALVIPITLYKVSLARKWITRTLLALWLVMLLGGILFTQSRGGWLALVVGSGFYLAVWLLQKKSARHSFASQVVMKNRGRWLVVAGAVVLAGLLIWLVISFRSFGEGLDIRQQVMAGAVKTLLNHPLFGSGPGTLGEELIRHQQLLATIWADAHNLLLTLTAETGLVGAVGLAWLGVICFKLLWFMLQSVSPPEVNIVPDKPGVEPLGGPGPAEASTPTAGRKLGAEPLGGPGPATGSTLIDRSWNMAGAACAAALLGFMAHNLVDSFFKFPLLMLLVAVLAGFWVSALTAQPHSHLWERKWGMWAMAAAMLIVVGNTVIGLREVQHIEAYNRAVEAAANGDWITAAVQLRLAQQVEPGLSFYRRQLAFAAGYLAEDDLAYRQEAIVQYQAALAGLDQLAIDRANFGCLLWTDGQQKPALQEMRRAKKLDPGDPVYRLNLGYYLELTGDWEGAQREYVEIITIWPEIIQSSYWQQTEQRAEALPQMAWQAAQNMGVLNAVQLLLETQNLEAARQLYEQYLQEGPVEPATQHLAWGKILLAAGELETAHAEFEAAVQANPRTAEAYLRLSQIALAQKRVGEAGQYIQAALFLLQSSETLYQAGQVEAAAGDTSQALKRYEAAFDLATLQSELNLTRYATEVARRRPLPANYLPCLRRLYPTRLLTEITQAEGNLLENLGRPEEAIPLIERLRYYEPTLPPVLEISCQDQVKVCSQ